MPSATPARLAREARLRCRTTATPDVAGAPKADSVTGTSVVSPPASMTPDWPVA